MKRILAWVLVSLLLLTLMGCEAVSGKDTVAERARLAWSKTMGSKAPDSTTEISHIEFTSRRALADALGIDVTNCNFLTSGLFAESGHLFGIVNAGKLRYVVAMDLDGEITWIFDVQAWKTRTGHARVSGLEFSMLATAVSNGVKTVYPAARSVEKDTWHRLTDEQIEELVKQ